MSRLEKMYDDSRVEILEMQIKGLKNSIDSLNAQIDELKAENEELELELETKEALLKIAVGERGGLKFDWRTTPIDVAKEILDSGVSRNNLYELIDHLRACANNSDNFCENVYKQEPIGKE